MEKKRKSLKQLLTEFKKDPRDRDAQEALEAESAGRRFILVEAEEVDVEGSVKAAKLARDTGMPFEGALTVGEAISELAPAYQADPITGRPLAGGLTSTKPRIDWGPAFKSGRAVLAAYAVETGQLPAGADSEGATHALSKATLDPPWSRFALEVEKLRKSMRAEDKALLLRVESRLVFSPVRREVAAERGPFVDDRPAAPVTALAGSVSVGGSVSGSVIVAGSGNMVGAGPAPVRIFVFHAREDEADALQLRKQMTLMVRTGKAVVSDVSDVRAGATTRTETARMIREADVIVVLYSAALSVDCWDEMLEFQQISKAGAKRVIPVLLSRVMGFEEGPLGKLLPLPSSDKPLSAFRDRDEGWSEVVSGIRRVVDAVARGR